MFNSLSLRFNNADLESKFYKHYFEKKKKHIQIALYVSLSFYAGFAIFDYLLDGTDMLVSLIVRFGVVCPYIYGVILLSKTRYYERFIQLAICIGMLLASMGIMVIAAASEQHIGSMFISGLLLILLWFHLLSGVLTQYAIETSIMVFVLYVLFIVFVVQYPFTFAFSNASFLLSAIVIASFSNYLVEKYDRNEFLNIRALENERKKNEELLLNILPRSIVNELKDSSGTIAQGFDSISILFADIVGFSEFGDKTTPKSMVSNLNAIFSRFDNLVDTSGLEKIKTIGDAYMVASGLPTPTKDHAQIIADFALNLQRSLDQFNRDTGQNFQLRIGIHSGSAVAGVIGLRKFVYDVWGDSVKVASHMETNGEPGKIHVSHGTYELLKDNYRFEKREPIEIKGKGMMQTYYLLSQQA